MYSTKRLASSLLFAFILSAGPAAGLPRGEESKSIAQQKSNSSQSPANALYFLTNEAQNAVAALKINSDGTLSAGSCTGTGGAGSNGIDGSTGQPAVPDALFSQSALTVAGNHLFAVNAGSNTVSMFAISRSDPTSLKPMGRPAGLPGDFPVTVAASAKHGMVCAGTTGALAGVSCARFSAKGGIGEFDALRGFDLGQSNPPVGPTNTVSQVFFNDVQDTLFATVKGDPAKNNTGFLASFPVLRQNGGTCGVSVSAQGSMASPSGTAVLFGARPLPDTGDGSAGNSSRIFATDASFGAAVLGAGSQGQATVLGKGTLADQKATCWATLNDVTGTAFVTDVGINRLVEMSVENASVLGEVDLSATGDPGLIDLTSSGSFVYALSPGNGTTSAAISVVDVKGGAEEAKLVQHFQLTGVAGKNSQGIAVFHS
ncbi:hypothetical protein JX265_006646 [Neoarthrinium moseri]|uniref:3-carboxymuconate cyclase n=1 Tax=Neoarthrinium moseri TaxID=1658444 RepID=A0A9Q0AQB3_9PEZI|nr:hypothetical protein JX265_006646 [Neoarthrinium moseri]